MIRSQKGFTLIEVLIALIILSGTSLVLVQSRSSSVNAVVKGVTYTNVTFLLQSKITEFEIKNRETKADELKETDSGSFDGFPDYTWEIKVQPMTIPNLVPPAQNGEAANPMADMIFKTISDYFEKAVREVLVTVIDKKTKKRYSVSTIYIDYTKELAPPGMGG